ncbi:MAG: hypothetical protein OEN21_16790 [Myxococcales bacterium]|nr:hypothetical protein [Myxococcales bacterium]
MFIRIACMGIFVSSTLGCGDNTNYNRWVSPPRDDGSVLHTPSSPPPSLLECMPSAAAWNDITRLYIDTENSIHELITCGQVQVRLAQSMLAIVLASNEELFRGDAFETISGYADMLGLDLQTPFEPAEDGRWTMPIAGADPSSRFWVQFFRPGSDAPILDDPFRLDSYLKGVYVDTELTLDQMLDDLDRRNTFSFTWEQEGPLVDLLNGGKPLAQLFTIEVSILDIASLVWPFVDSEGADFGPLLSLVDAEMISCVELKDTRNNTIVEYQADGRRDSISEIAGQGQVGFDLDAIQATDGRYTLLGDASDLRYVGVKSLAGEIRYEAAGLDLSLRITSDFGSGQPWPVTSWDCDPCVPD